MYVHVCVTKDLKPLHETLDRESKKYMHAADSVLQCLCSVHVYVTCTCNMPFPFYRRLEIFF